MFIFEYTEEKQEAILLKVFMFQLMHFSLNFLLLAVFSELCFQYDNLTVNCREQGSPGSEEMQFFFHFKSRNTNGIQ